VFVKDLGYVRDGSLVQQNVVRSDERRSVLLSVIKNGNASTVDIVRQVKKALKVARASAPPGMEIKELLDQSVFVSASVDSLLREGAIAAGLTALMILLFLGSWRPTLVVMISIPLSVLSSLVVLHFLGDTLNTMTLGGLALAIGIGRPNFTRHLRHVLLDGAAVRDAVLMGPNARHIKAVNIRCPNGSPIGPARFCSLAGAQIRGAALRNGFSKSAAR
jgi:predicted exporter